MFCCRRVSCDLAAAALLGSCGMRKDLNPQQWEIKCKRLDHQMVTGLQRDLARITLTLDAECFIQPQNPLVNDP